MDDAVSCLGAIQRATRVTSTILVLGLADAVELCVSKGTVA